MLTRGGGGEQATTKFNIFLVASRGQCGNANSLDMQLGDTPYIMTYNKLRSYTRQLIKQVITTRKPGLETTENDRDENVIRSSHSWGSALSPLKRQGTTNKPTRILVNAQVPNQQRQLFGGAPNPHKRAQGTTTQLGRSRETLTVQGSPQNPRVTRRIRVFFGEVVDQDLLQLSLKGWNQWMDRKAQDFLGVEQWWRKYWIRPFLVGKKGPIYRSQKIRQLC